MINLEEIQMVLNQTATPTEFSTKILAELQALEEEKKASRESGKKKNKSQFIVFSKGEGIETVSHVIQIGQEDDPAMLLGKIKEAAVEHNLNCKKKANMVTDFEDIIHIKRKYSKEKGWALKTKTDWVRTIVLTPEQEKIAVSNLSN